MTNGEQMFWGRQSGSFFLHTWAAAPRERVTVLPWKPHRPGPAASAGRRRCAGPLGQLLLPGGQQPWDKDELLSEAGDKRSAFSRPATPQRFYATVTGTH